LLAFYMLKDGDHAWAAATSRLSGWRRQEVDIAAHESVTKLGGYMIATGSLGLFNAVTGYVIMVLLGLPLALPVAVLSFFGGFIPYIGQFITSAIAFLVAFAFGSTTDIVIMGIYTAIMNVVQGSVIAPLVYGRAVSLHPAVVLVAIPAGGTLAGVLGMFLAVPILGIAAGVWRHVLTAMGSEDPATRIEETEATVTAPATAPPIQAPVRGPAPGT
jgi:putative heme transporter